MASRLNVVKRQQRRFGYNVKFSRDTRSLRDVFILWNDQMVSVVFMGDDDAHPVSDKLINEDLREIFFGEPCSLPDVKAIVLTQENNKEHFYRGLIKTI